MMTTTTKFLRRGALAAIAVAAATMMLASSAFAQGAAPDARWQGWLGCWQPVTATSADSYSAWMDQRARDAGAPALCIVPANTATSVDFVTVGRDGKVTAREAIDASGNSLARERDGCSGNESAHWSSDARRIYVSSSYACPNGLARKSSGMLTMSGNGQLVDIQEVAIGATRSVRVARYQSVAAPTGFSLDSAVVPNANSMPVSTARTALSGALTGADIADAVHNVDTLVVEAWLVERGERFQVNAGRLAALADAGVPGRITDLMVALAYPKVFALDQSLRVATTIPRGSTIYATLPPADPFGYRGYGGYPLGYGPLGYSPFLYSPYSYDGYNRYGYSGYGGYGYGGYGGYLYQPPVVIIRNPNGGSGQTHGRVVNGQGYTRGGSSSGSTGSSGSSPRSASGGSTSSSGSSSGTASSGSSSSSSGETRQAKPRP